MRSGKERCIQYRKPLVNWSRDAEANCTNFLQNLHRHGEQRFTNKHRLLLSSNGLDTRFLFWATGFETDSRRGEAVCSARGGKVSAIFNFIFPGIGL